MSTNLDVEKLSGNTARAILRSLLTQECINLDLIHAAMRQNPSNELKRLTDNIHLMFCQEHNKNPCLCKYYEEEEVDTTWSEEGHTKWLDKTFSIMEECDLGSEADFTKLYGKVREAQEYLAKLKSATPHAYKMLCRFNDWKED